MRIFKRNKKQKITMRDYKFLAIDKLKMEYEQIPDTKETVANRIERMGQMTMLACANTKEEVRKLFLKKFLF